MIVSRPWPGRVSAGRAGAGAGRAAAGARRPLWVWAAPFALFAAVLVARNSFLFSTRLYEEGDMASNSLRIEEARHFTLLIGDYSRLQFSHPGPAYLYVQAWGEELWYDLLHVVPTAWNGQLLAVYALNSAWVALAVGVVYGWTRTARGAAAGLAAIAAVAAVHPLILSSDWMSYLYVATYTVFVIAAASVAAGRAQDGWILALSGWFLIHGHASFLFIVPAFLAVVLAAVLWPRRRTLRGWLPSFLARRRAAWVPVAVISGVFALPMAAELALHWPGPFAGYFDYGTSAKAGGHPLGAVVRYVLWYWSPRAVPPATRLLALVPVLLLGTGALVAWRYTAGPVRRFLLALLAMDLVSSVIFVGYAMTGVDDLTVKGHYIGYFYWSAPLVALLVIAVGVTEAVAGRGGARIAAASTAVTLAAVLAAVALFSVRPYARTPTRYTDPAVPSFAPDTDPAIANAVAVVAARSPHKTIVLKLDHGAWRDTNGFLVQAYRTGVRACIDHPWWTFMVTSKFICTPGQVATGARYFIWNNQTPPRGRVLATMYNGRITAGWPK